MALNFMIGFNFSFYYMFKSTLVNKNYKNFFWFIKQYSCKYIYFLLKKDQKILFELKKWVKRKQQHKQWQKDLFHIQI